MNSRFLVEDSTAFCFESLKTVNPNEPSGALKQLAFFAHDEVNVHCSPAKKVFFSTIVNFIMSAF